MNTGEKIRDRRNYVGLSLRALAGNIGVSFQAVQRWEKGETFPRKKNLSKLLKILDIPASYLIDSPGDGKLDQTCIPPDILEAVNDPEMQAVVRAAMKLRN